MKTKTTSSLSKILSFLMVLCLMAGVVMPLMSVTASAAAPTSYTTITTNSTASVRITSSGGAKYFKFVPTQSGTYKFYSTNYNSDPYGALLNASGTTLKTDDDSGTDYNFSITYDCTANTTYYIKAYLYSSSSTGSYTLNVETVSTTGTTPTTPTGSVVNITTSGAYSLFNSGATSSSGYKSSSARDGVDSNPDSHSYSNSGYDIYGRAPSRGTVTIGMGLSFTISQSITERTALTVYAYDIDEESGQIDTISLVDETTGEKSTVGYLSGMDGEWNTTTIYIDASNFVVGHTYHFENTISNGTWWTWIRTVSIQMTTDGEPPVTPTEPTITDHSFDASINSSGTVTTNLYLQTSESVTYTLEYAASINGNQKGSSLGQTISATTAGVNKQVSFSLESGSPTGTYQIDVIVKDSLGNTIVTYTTTTGHSYSAVSYNSNGGSNQLPIDTNAYSSGDTVTVLFDYIPSRTDYIFLGWATSSSATTPDYTENGTNTFTIGSSDVTLYAIWELDVCDHVWEETSRTEPTCTTNGLVINTCSSCGETDEEVLEKLGHNYVSGTCTRCGAAEPTADVWDGSISTGFGGGTGTESDPYLIYTGAQLAYLAQQTNNGTTYSGKYFKLMNNIDLNNIEWTPIGIGSSDGWEYESSLTEYFSGNFLGNFHTISNLHQTQTYLGRTGLFGLLNNATISNLAIKNTDIEASNNGTYEHTVAGILAGVVNESEINHCFISGSLNIYHHYSGKASAVGGIFGHISGGTITNCTVEAHITVENSSSSFNAYAGGLVGVMRDSTVVANCYYNGQIDATAYSTDVYVSGIIGCTNNTTSSAKIENCFVVGILKGTASNAYTSAVYKVYAYWSSSISYANCYYNATFISNSSTGTSSSYGTSTDISNFASQSWIESNLGWDFTNIWEMKPGADYPTLRGFGEGGITPPVHTTHSYTESSRTPATCTAYGEVTYTCSCGASYSELLEPTGHNYQAVTTVEPTCTTDGYIDYACANGCGATKHQVLPMLGHDFVGSICYRCGYEIIVHTHEYSENVVAPTCTSMGYTEYTCSCGHSYRGNYIDTTRHNWDSGVITIEKTCTTDGLKTYTCQDCSATKTEILSAGHEWSETVTVEKTCMVNGSKTKTCTACGATETEVIPAGHNWDAGIVTLEPTCAADGSKTCTCLDCGTTEAIAISKLGHHFENGVCTRCGIRFIEIVDPSAHPLYGMYFEIDDILSDYGPSLIDEYGVMLDYNSDAILTKVAVYLTQDGTMWRRCIAVKGTGITYATYVPYLSYQSDIKYTGLNHNWINTFRLSENSKGIWCYSDYTTIGVNLEDAYGNLLLSLYDIGQAGAETRIFDDLDEMKAWLEDDGHVHEASDWMIDVEPTCIAGRQHKECTLCGVILEVENIAPVAEHTPSGWIVDVQPTATQTGSRHKECTVCGATPLETEIMPILATIQIENVEAEAGKTITVKIDVQNNPGIIGALLTIEFDPALTLVNAEAGGAWNSLTFTKPATWTNPCNFVWDGVNNADYSNGTIIILTFEVPDGAGIGTVYAIEASYTPNNMINANLEPMNMVIVPGSITVINPIGDVNDDGVVDVADVVTLRRYLVGGYGVTIDEVAADLDYDGTITVTDLVLLRRFVVDGTLPHIFGNWSVTETPSTTETGTLQRTCSCGPTHTETFTLPQLGEAGYTLITNTPPSCEGTGSGTYEYTKDGQTFAFDVVLAALGHHFVSGSCTVCGEEEGTAYVRVNASGITDAEGEYLLFGSWPQGEVTDSALKSALTATAGTLPTASESYGWTSYGYYKSGSNDENYMWYIDIPYDGELYRGVYFTSYRPYYTSGTSSSTEQDNNGYYTSTVYWFKWEPLQWRILSEQGGEALLLCEMLIDSQAYQNNVVSSGSDYYATDEEGNILTGVYANNYQYSTIRAWLEDTFYAQAFTDLQKSIIQTITVDNSAFSTTDSGNNLTQATQYACANTQDKVFLLSAQEVTASGYDFASYSTSDPLRQKKPTDYAQCQGANTSTGGTYAGNGWWWLRSPNCGGGEYACVVSSDGHALAGSYLVDVTYRGVCPALWIAL